MARLIFCFLILAIGFSCQPSSDSIVVESNQPISIIPEPAFFLSKPTGSYFTINNKTKIVIPDQTDQWKAVAKALISKFETQGISLENGNNANLNNAIIFESSRDSMVSESYEMSISHQGIYIDTKDPNGAFYAVQTLLQLLPKEIFSNEKITGVDWKVPHLKIGDMPRFKYRGMHLDVARHFFNVEEVKKYIDLLAMHKMNTFHWHLTEDQGWRIEIKKYPKLTEIGAYRNGTLIGHYNDEPQQYDGKRYGGFYTQEEIKEVVQYAKERFITVIPEIELPGHAQAAIAAYPELGCTDSRVEVLQKWGVSENVYCPKEETFVFLENVLKEVMDLFPGKYIHIGGDECPKTQWKESAFCQNLMKQNGLTDEMELQSYFIKRIEKFINANGKQIIGWDEILEGGLAPNATVMSWRGTEGGIEAARQGHEVVMTPTSHCYLDYYQSDHPDEPLAIGGFLPLKTVYNYEPIPEELTKEEAKYVIGTQGNVWTEYMKTFEQVEYMAYPRACAIAETAWSFPDAKNFPNFIERLVPHMERLKALDVNVANHLYELQTIFNPTGKSTVLKFETLASDAEIYYTIDGATPTTSSKLYINPIEIKELLTIKAQSFKQGEKVGRPWQQFFDMHKAAGELITLKNNPHKKYSGGGNGSIINGVNGSDERYGDAEWLGFPDGTDFEAVIDFGNETTFENIKCRFFKGEGQWIYLPKSLEIFTSFDGIQYTSINKTNNIKTDSKVATIELDLKKVSGKYLKVIAKNHGTIPEGAQGAGHQAWLFVDEIVVR